MQTYHSSQKNQEKKLPILIILQEHIKTALDIKLKWMYVWGLFWVFFLLCAFKIFPFLAVTLPNTKDN